MLKTTATEARGAHTERERERERASENMGGADRTGMGGDRREIRWGWREQLIHCIQLRLQYSQA